MVWNGRAGAGLVQGPRVFTLKAVRVKKDSVDVARENYIRAANQYGHAHEFTLAARRKWEELRGRSLPS